MKRRTYLAATALTLGGCAGASQSDPTDGTNESDPGNGTDDPGDESNDSDSTARTDDADETEETDDSEEETTDEEEESGRFGDFEDLSQWTVMDGSLSADEERSVVGSQSALLEADAAENRVMIKREFDKPRDLTTELPSLAVASDTRVNPWIQLTDADGDRLVLRAAVREELPLDYRNFGVTDVVGDPDMSAIEYVKISAWAGEDRAVRLWCDDFHFVERPDTGTVLIQFDTSDESAYTDAFPVLEEFGYAATAFVSPDRIGDDGRLTVEQLEELRDAGWAIGSGGMAGGDVTWREDAEKEAQIADAAAWLEEHGFEDGARYFAYPNGEYDKHTLELAAEHHDLAFAGGYPNHGAVTNPALCPRAVAPGAREVRDLVERTARFGGITTITYRQLAASSDWSFESMVEYLTELESAGDLKVALPGDVRDEYVA